MTIPEFQPNLALTVRTFVLISDVAPRRLIVVMFRCTYIRYLRSLVVKQVNGLVTCFQRRFIRRGNHSVKCIRVGVHLSPLFVSPTILYRGFARVSPANLEELWIKPEGDAHKNLRISRNGIINEVHSQSQKNKRNYN